MLGCGDALGPVCGLAEDAWLGVPPEGLETPWDGPVGLVGAFGVFGVFGELDTVLAVLLGCIGTWEASWIGACGDCDVLSTGACWDVSGFMSSYIGAERLH